MWANADGLSVRLVQPSLKFSQGAEIWPALRCLLQFRCVYENNKHKQAKALDPCANIKNKKPNFI